MKTKAIILSIAALLLASLACNSTEPQNVPLQTTPTNTNLEGSQTREALVTSTAPLYLTPQNWAITPQQCYKSMARVWFFHSNLIDISSGSSSFVYTQSLHNSNGDVAWVYHLLTANHIVTNPNSGEAYDGKVILFPGNYQNQDHEFELLSQIRIKNTEKNLDTDINLVSIVGHGEQANISNENFMQLGVENLISGTGLSHSNSMFFSFDYPGSSGEPQFTISTVGSGNAENQTLFIMNPVEGYGTVTNGSSGGAICNTDSKLVGVASIINNVSSPTAFQMEPNPTDIQYQVAEAIRRAQEKLFNLGYK